MSSPRYTLYWSPEGRPIATGVEARSARAAKRKAPHPYRRYLGEIGAELENPNAYKAVISLHSEGFLLGGSRMHASEPFESEADARAWAIQAVEVNKARSGYLGADIRLAIVPVRVRMAIPAGGVSCL